MAAWDDTIPAATPTERESAKVLLRMAGSSDPKQVDFNVIATRSGIETLANKTLAGPVSFVTNGSRIGITSEAVALSPTGLVQVVNRQVSTALRVSSYWTGSAASPFQNHDDCLFESFNKVLSNSLNQSWAVSAPNAYNDIPAGVIDSGMRVGVYGWATSIFVPGEFEHAGTLNLQIGVRGRAGFQGGGTPATAVIQNAFGVQGEIFGEAVGATIQNAAAGRFLSLDPLSTIQNNVAVYAAARGGTITNYAWLSEAGMMLQTDKAIFGPTATATQSPSNISVRGINSVEFGNPDPSGYGSHLGATASSGTPFLALCAEAMPTGNGFKTRGKKGVIVTTDLAGSLIFQRVPLATADSQVPVEMGRFTDAGQLILSGSVRPGSYTVATVPSAAAQGAGAIIYVSNETGGAVPAFSDGSAWRRVTDRAVIA